MQQQAACRQPKRSNTTHLASALGRLALSHPHAAITCHDETSSKPKRLPTRNFIPDSERYTRVAASANKLCIRGLVAAVRHPDSKSEAVPSVSLQELSINGTPVVNTSIHEYVATVHKRTLAAQKRKGHTPQPDSYFLQLTISSDDVTFTGPALHRSALIPMSHGVRQLLASVLIQAWGKVMPATVVGELQATMEQPLPRSMPVHPEQSKLAQQPTHDAHKGMICAAKITFGTVYFCSVRRDFSLSSTICRRSKDHNSYIPSSV